MANSKPIFQTLALVLCLFAQMSWQAVPFPQAVIQEMSSREARYHHYLWHNIRDNWNAFSNTTKKQLKDLGWEPPRPSRSFDANGNAVAITDNNSGEDFLYMHRQMIKRVNDIINQTNDPYGPLISWKTLPAPGDAEWPVPAQYTISGSPSTTSSINTRKTVDYYNSNIKPMEDFFKDPVQLRTMTLGQLGSRLESTLHNWLHLRFSNQSTYGYRPGASGAIPSIATKWDDPQYNWLGDTYSSHVNPVFWKLHGWVNDRVTDWARANNLTVITWKGTWQGGPMGNISSIIGTASTNTTATAAKRTATVSLKRGSTATTSTPAPASTDNSMAGMEGMEGMHHGSSSDPAFLDETMDKVFNIFAKGGKEMSFADDVQVDFEIPKPKTKTNLRKLRDSN